VQRATLNTSPLAGRYTDTLAGARDEGAVLKHDTAEGGETKKMTGMLALVTIGILPSTDSTAASLIAKKKPGLNKEAAFAELSKYVETLRKDITWPGRHWLADVESGALARVENCTFPGRVPFGTCRLEDSSPEFSWSAALDYFDVATTRHSDSGLKSCLRMGGKWSTSTAPIR
jgi:hypothetical protein